MWYMEYKDYKFGDDEGNDLHEIGHYTQIAWATTHLVGCGVSHCTGGKGPLGKDFFMYVCNYAPSNFDCYYWSNLENLNIQGRNLTQKFAFECAGEEAYYEIKFD
ncbi:hypothetical protein E2986_13763 [Frieseomelitta varia]|uniref:SCP domain-containing protein n=1 Tax=Frieseomelitta varia TaxID=561572 RepID=A0A833RPJ8_9HYME|nr:hypothetical protein E2986_13763 [Frieseomelitta varia]